MWDEGLDSGPATDWSPVALRGGVASLRLPAGWTRQYRDDGGLAYQSPGQDPVDLLVSLTTYRNPYGVRADDAIQYLDREHVLPHGISPAEEDADDGRRWIAYAVTQPPDRQIFVWKVADFLPPDLVRVVTVQLLVPEGTTGRSDLDELIDRLGEEVARIQFHPAPVAEPVQRVTMRNVAHGEMLRFRLPWDWQMDKDGELSVFFREEADTGTLRVAVHHFPHNGASGPVGEAEAQALAATVLRQTASQFADGPDGRVGEGSMEELPGGSGVLARFSTDGEEDGEKLRFHLWLRGTAADGQTTLALFSYVMSESRRGTDMERDTLSMLESEIRAAIIGKTEVEETDALLDLEEDDEDEGDEDDDDLDEDDDLPG